MVVVDEIRKKAQAIAKQERKNAPPITPQPDNNDPLVILDRDGNRISHCLRNLWSPCAAFLVCGGPSLSRFPLESLRERGVASLGVNNAAGYAPVSAFVCGDPPEKFHHGIFFDPKVIKFVPRTKLRKRVRAKAGDSFRWTTYRVRDCPNVFAFERTAEFDPDGFLTTEGATWGNNSEAVKKNGRPKILFTFFLGLRLLHYLGARRVYMLGVDFVMAPGDRQQGAYAFPQAGHGNGNNDHYRTALPMLRELRETFRLAQFEVYNCNPESRLTVFPHVPFEVALNDCRGGVPTEPFDLEGWYEKPGDKELDMERERS